MAENTILQLAQDVYNPGIEMLSQQTDSRLRSHVRVEYDKGERVNFQRLGAVRVRDRDTRNGDTEYINSQHTRRWVVPTDKDIAELMDETDLLKILENPGGAYSREMIAAFNRDIDKTIIDAALGTAITGKRGTGSQAFDSNMQIANGGTGFTLAKLRTTAQLLKEGEAFDPNMGLVVAWTAEQEDEFLNTTEVKSVDYNTQKVLMGGQMGDEGFYGFHFVRLEDWTDEEGTTVNILPKASTVRSCVAWLKNGIVYNEWQSPRVRVSELPSKKHSWQFYADASYGAVRMQESKVVQIDCVEAS